MNSEKDRPPEEDNSEEPIVPIQPPDLVKEGVEPDEVAVVDS